MVKSLITQARIKCNTFSAVLLCTCSIPWGGDSYMEQTGMLVGNFELTLKETIWPWLKLFVTPKGDQSGRGLSKV